MEKVHHKDKVISSTSITFETSGGETCQEYIAEATKMFESILKDSMKDGEILSEITIRVRPYIKPLIATDAETEEEKKCCSEKKYLVNPCPYGSSNKYRMEKKYLVNPFYSKKCVEKPEKEEEEGNIEDLFGKLAEGVRAIVTLYDDHDGPSSILAKMVLGDAILENIFEGSKVDDELFAEVRDAFLKKIIGSK